MAKVSHSYAGCGSEFCLYTEQNIFFCRAYFYSDQLTQLLIYSEANSDRFFFFFFLFSRLLFFSVLSFLFFPFSFSAFIWAAFLFRDAPKTTSPPLSN